jgi:hypothetical protein
MVADLSIAHHQKMPMTISHRVRLRKLAVDVLQEKATTAMIPKKLKSTTENSKVPIV